MTQAPFRVDVADVQEASQLGTFMGGVGFPGDGLPCSTGRINVGSHSSAVHSNSAHLLYLAKESEGVLDIDLDGNKREARTYKDMLIFAPNGTDQNFSFEGQTDNILASIDAQFFENLAHDWDPNSSPGQLEPMMPFSNPRIAHLITDMHRNFAGLSFGWRITLQALTMQLGVEIFRIFLGPSKQARRRQLNKSDLDSIDQFIEAFIETDIGLSDLSDTLGMDVFAVSRAFKEAVGIPPGRYLLERRVDHASELLLSTDQPLSEVAYQCGFSSQSHMTTTFTQRLGISPGRYRREARK